MRFYHRICQIVSYEPGRLKCIFDEVRILVTFSKSLKLNSTIPFKITFNSCDQTPPTRSGTDPKPICHFDPLLLMIIYVFGILIRTFPLRNCSKRKGHPSMEKGITNVISIKYFIGNAKICQSAFYREF